MLWEKLKDEVEVILFTDSLFALEYFSSLYAKIYDWVKKSWNNNLGTTAIYTPWHLNFESADYRFISTLRKEMGVAS